MKKMKLLGLLGVIGLSVLLTGCGKVVEKDENLSMTLESIMTSVYANVDDDKLPMMLGNTEITTENLEGYTGLTVLDYESGLASESMVGSIAHSVVLLRVKDNVDIDKTKTEIKEKVNPRKWICVGIDDDKNVIVDNIGNTIILIMDNEIAENLHNNFTALKTK